MRKHGDTRFACDEARCVDVELPGEASSKFPRDLNALRNRRLAGPSASVSRFPQVFVDLIANGPS